MKLLQWLESGVLPRLAELCALNGGDLVIHNPPVPAYIPTDKNRYGRFGLLPQDFIEMHFLTGIWAGLCMCVSEEEIFEAKKKIQHEIDGRILFMPTAEELRKFSIQAKPPEKRIHAK
jgi:hypothetical protein